MANFFFRLMPIAVIAAIVGACDRAPAGPSDRKAVLRVNLSTNVTTSADREVSEQISDFTGALVAFPCGDGYTEQVLMEGKIFERYITSRDAAGGIHVVVHTMPIGLRGVGQTTGAEYRIADREQGVFNQGTMGQTTSSYQHFLKVSAPSIGLRATLAVGGMFAVNANGALTVERPILRAECHT